MSKYLIQDREYINWISQLSIRYRASQIKASISVNRDMLSFYWNLGKGIVAHQNENKYGSNFFKILSRDLKEAIPKAKCFSVNNLYYIRQFYILYINISHQLEGNSIDQISHQLEGLLFSTPWGHHKLLIDKHFDQPETVLFYLVESNKKGWSRNMLLNALDTDLHLRQGKAISNFKELLPSPTSDIAQELTKDPYMFDFTNMVVPFQERELKEALLKDITNFLLELGEGFAYLGREYRLKVGNTEQFTDLLFYNLKLRCYVVIEIKTGKFEASHLGQLGMYVSAVNHILKTQHDNPTIGLLICKTKDNVLAQYALEGYNLPIGVSQYQLEKHLPKEYKSTLPTIEEIEAKLKG